MGPICRRRSTRRTTRPKPAPSTPKRKKSTLFKKQPSKNKQPTTPTDSPTNKCKAKSEESKNKDAKEDKPTSTNAMPCSTPKAKRYRIPEIETCPPAPMKSRRAVTGNSASAFSLRRTPVTFFTSPDIDLFFYLTLRGI